MAAPVSTFSLVKYDAMCLAIEQAHAVDEVKDIRDRALALQAYARQAQNEELERKAATIRIRAERRAGELLRKNRPKWGTGRSWWRQKIKVVGIDFDFNPARTRYFPRSIFTVAKIGEGAQGEVRGRTRQPSGSEYQWNP